MRQEGGIVVDVVVLLDRQERLCGAVPRSALGITSEELGMPVKTVIKFSDLIEGVERGRIQG